MQNTKGGNANPTQTPDRRPSFDIPHTFYRIGAPSDGHNGADVYVKPNAEPTVSGLRQNLLNHFRGAFNSVSNLTQENLAKNELREKSSANIEKCMVDPAEGGGSNILHWIARQMGHENIDDHTAGWLAAECLAEIATRMKPEMLVAEYRDSNLTPIHIFMECAQIAPRRAGSVILAMCRAAEESSPEGKRFVSDIISKKNQDDENCLHLAIKRDLGICSQLIGMASPDAMAALCKTKRNTPLHYAVARSCLDAVLKRLANSHLRGEYESLGEQMKKDHGRHLDEIAALIAKNPKTLMIQNSEGRSPYLYYMHLREEAMKNATSDRPDFDYTTEPFEDDLIEEHLVESALSLGSFDAACDCFFESDFEKRELESVFRPERPLARFDDNTYSFFRCGTTLAHVDLSIDFGDASSESTSLIVLDAREVLSKIFKMLHNKRVRRILKLTVQDNPNAPCSDEFIVSCLHPFDIRYLDWNKPDLCIDVVIAAVPRVSELRLYCTGNSAAIRSWAGSNGLVNLNQLRSVFIQPWSCAVPEAASRQAQCIREFQTDLWENIETSRKFKIMTMAWQGYLDYADHLQMRRQLLVQSGPNEVRDDLVAREAELAEIERSMLENEDDNARLAIRIATFLLQKETYEQKIACRLQGRRDDENDRPDESVDVTKSQNETDERRISRQLRGSLVGNKGELAKSVDVTDLQRWGIRDLRDCSYRFDFLALEFCIDQGLIKQPPDQKMVEQRVMPVEQEESKPGQHRWMKTLKNFISHNVHGNSIKKKVKVALIDDGVDVNMPYLRGKVKCGWPKEKPTSSSDPFYQSFGGHGTAMAHLITTACPHVELYVAQLKTFKAGGPHSDNTWKNAAEEVTEAIRWARENNVHIISMSWKIKATIGNKNEVRKLNCQIERASAENIIMYCAASGQHSSSERFYPASASSCVNIVGSAKEDGKPSDFVSTDEVDYLFPGEDLQEIGARKGNSAATALAAGFAALVIWCYESQPNGGQKLTPSDMNRIFKELQPMAKRSRDSDDIRSKWVDISLMLKDESRVSDVAKLASAMIERRRLIEGR